MPVRAVVVDLDSLVPGGVGADYGSARSDLVDLAREWPDVRVPVGDPRTACLATLDALADDARWLAASAAVARYEAIAVRALRGAAVAAQGPGAVEPAGPSPLVVVVTILPDALAREVLRISAAPALPIVGRRPALVLSGPEPRLRAACAALGVPPADATLVSGDSSSRGVAARLGLGWVERPAEVLGGQGILGPGDLVEALRTVLAARTGGPDDASG